MDYAEHNANRKARREVTWDVLEFTDDSLVVEERELTDEEAAEFRRLAREGKL